MQEIIKKNIDESIQAKEQLAALSPFVQAAGEHLIACNKSGGKILIAGNGGSASQASHMAGELVGRYLKERKAIAALSLSTDTSVLTAWSNDYSYDTVFSRQIEALGKEEDTLIVLSTSGNSQNLILAVAEAKKKGMKSIALLGRDGGKMKGMADLEIIVPNDSTPRIQECHILLIHTLCELVEAALT